MKMYEVICPEKGYATHVKRGMAVMLAKSISRIHQTKVYISSPSGIVQQIWHGGELYKGSQLR